MTCRDCGEVARLAHVTDGQPITYFCMDCVERLTRTEHVTGHWLSATFIEVQRFDL